MPDKPQFQRIDFDRLEAALVDRAPTLVPEWLRGGKRVSNEWVCADLGGGEGTSCSVNLSNGKWADFSSEARGTNLLDLYCAIHEPLDRVTAARELMVVLGWATGAAPDRVRAVPVAPSKPPPPDEGWKTVRPVPDTAPAVNFKHYHRAESDIEHVAEYRDEHGLHGYVARFRTSEGGKDPLPRTWCTSSRDGASKWHWRQWDEPRPLYLPGHRRPGRRTVVLVEGEKKADALHALLELGAPGTYCVASWPGGSKAWPKGDWAWLAGLHVLAWPDCDSQREALTAAERKATPDKAAQLVLRQAKPLLPVDEQPGMKAMLGIGAHLRTDHGCTVQLLPIPEPGTVADGWDCADAIAEGWGIDQVLELFGKAYALPEWAGAKKPKPAAAPAGPPEPPDKPPADAPAGAGDDDAGGEDRFQEHLDFMCENMKCKVWEIGVTRKLVIAALTKSSGLVGCLHFNELPNAPCTVRPWPWRTEPGVLGQNDDLRLGDWLSREYGLKSASRAALSEAIDTVADGNRFHPIRDWLRGLKHDGKPRLDKWLMHVLNVDPATVPAKRQRYLALVGRYMLLGLVARVMTPGCKFDYSPVLEGKAGRGKSTFVKTLVGAEFFSDTHFDIGNGKDGMEQLEGLWAYELSEMTAFRKADSEQVKQFFSSTIDRFRGAYDKYVEQHPRQCVIFCTTNKRQYLYDLSGNRRFWPFWVEGWLRLAWLAKWRAQLFAEAFALWEKGERIFPTPDEEKSYFEPEQELRLVETTVQGRLYELLTREGAPATEARATRDLSQLTPFVTMPMLCEALGSDPAKSTAMLETQIRSWLDAYGWLAHRETTGSRRRGFRQPDVWPPTFEEEAPEANADGNVPLNGSEGHARADDLQDVSDDEPF